MKTLKTMSAWKGDWREVMFVCVCDIKGKARDFPDGTVEKNLPANAGDVGLIPGLGRLHVSWSG